jgi:hypothetical protein
MVTMSVEVKIRFKQILKERTILRKFSSKFSPATEKKLIWICEVKAPKSI